MTNYHNNTDFFYKLIKHNTKIVNAQEYDIWDELTQIKKGQFLFLIFITHKPVHGHKKKKWCVYVNIVYDQKDKYIVSQKFFKKKFKKIINAYYYYYNIKEYITNKYIYQILSSCKKNRIPIKLYFI